MLFRDWDPVNVNSNENLRDEYDSYIGRIYHVLVSTPTREAVAHELAMIEHHSMGIVAPDTDALRRREEGLFPVANKLLLIDRSLPQ